MIGSVAFGSLFTLLALGIPIFVALGIVSLLLFAGDGAPLVDAALVIMEGLDSPAFVAVPFFVIAAAFMEKGGIIRVMIDAAHSWVGRAPGGLALVCVFATTIFAAISGSSVATALAMGTLLVPAMTARHYDRSFALGVVGASGTVGILIPPSLAMILYGIIADESVPRLFLAGVVPGLLQTAILALWILYYAKRKGFQAEAVSSRESRLKANLRVLPALLIPAAIFVGIYGGITTVSEAAAVATLLAMIIAIFVYREVRVGEIPAIFAGGIKSAGAITFILASALLFSHWITQSGVPARLVEMMLAHDLKPWQFLLLINALMIIFGMFFDAIAVVLIVVPLTLGAVQAFGIDMIHYGVIVTVNIELAMLTPPMGLNLFVLSSISKAPFTEVSRGVLPFIGLMIVLLALVTFIPALSTWLPNLVYGR
ncbi:MAG: TRAP transporter large permease subunit [Sphingomonadales bacterium]|nr:TRAP transporter large permease subunit [Sphingomonadales bacterium]